MSETKTEISKRKYRVTPTTEDRNVPLSEIMSIYGRSRTSVLRDIEVGRIPQPFKFGGKLYWRLSEIRASMDINGKGAANAA